MNIELYICNRLVDIDKPTLSIFLKRQFINPAQLNTKDAQKSYSITLPATANNNDIFAYTNIEEVQDKFRIYDNAKLYIGGVCVLDGKFVMTTITKDVYTGNLGIIAPVPISDVFGSETMNKAGTWILNNFKGSESITEYNTKDNAECIFPLILYGLLPKKGNVDNFTAKDVLDDSVYFGLEDFPPAVNCVQMLQRIFKNAGYTLTGSACNDERLSNLYVSYKNPSDYVMKWGLDGVTINGAWTNAKGEKPNAIVEQRAYKNTPDKPLYIVDLFSATNSELTTAPAFVDYVSKDENNTTSVIVPESGLYKIELSGSLKLSVQQDFTHTGGEFKVIEPKDVFGSTGSATVTKTQYLDEKRFELKVVRNIGDDLKDSKQDNNFYKDNINQDRNDPTCVFPKDGEVNFIDPMQNKHILCGLAFGNNPDTPNYKNPKNRDICNPFAVTGGYSHNRTEFPDFRGFSAVQSSGYVNQANNETGRFRVDLLNAPDNYTHTVDNMQGFGRISQVVWLEKGESIKVISTSDEGNREKFEGKYDYGWLRHSIDFSLTLTPYRYNRNWLKVETNGASSEAMNWGDKATFQTNKIDLVSFLPSNIKINDWIDNFCKAFNLNLENTGAKSFELNTKGTDIQSIISNVIDLDEKANIDERINEPLGLPYVYELGFSADNSEEGYYQTMQKEFDEDGEETGVVLNSGYAGGGTFYTGSYESNKAEQTSSFSYCWYKELKDSDGNTVVNVPVITEREIWEKDNDYLEMLTNSYFDKSQRFFYKSGLHEVLINNIYPVKVALVSNEYKGSRPMRLNYENQVGSIMRNYFLLLVNSGNNYTIVDCYLTPEEYDKLKISLIKFNGDLYNVAEIDGYDPLQNNKGRLKLIRRIL